MKKLILSSLTLMVVLTMLVGSTSAVFSDTKSIEGNTVATGTLKLTLNKSAGKPWSVEGMYPGMETGWEYMDIFNGPYPAQPGQLPFEAYIWLEKTAGSTDLYNALEIRLHDSGWNSTCGDGDDVLVYDGSLTAITGSGNREQTSDDDPNSSGPGGDNIMPGNSQRLCQKLRLPMSADNSVQGTTVTFTEWVDAVQDDD